MHSSRNKTFWLRPNSELCNTILCSFMYFLKVVVNLPAGSNVGNVIENIV